MSDCILWTDGALHDGYARVWNGGDRIMLHRKVYEDARGVLPADFDVHHRCGVRNCVNLDHLEALPHNEHTRLHKPPRTHCPQGHPMTPDNVYHYGAFRHCKICRRETQLRYEARKRASG